jgi:hypothetical protein
MGVFQNNLMGAAAAAASAGGDFYTHQIANSLRNSAAQDGTLKWTAGTPTSSTTFTLSYWVKKYNNDTGGADQNIFVAGTGGGTYFIIGFATGPEFWSLADGGNFTPGSSLFISTAFARDTSAWYHVVYRFDSTQATSTNRVRLYVNGEQITSFRSQTMQTNIAQDEAISFINESGVVQAFGGLSGKGHGTEGSDLQMAEIVFNDGQSYGADSYGEFKNGVWIPKDPSGLTFGNNGYWLKFESNSDLGNDSSGNNNDFTAANLPPEDQLIDSPTFNADNGGNYCTINPLNTRCTGSGNNWVGIIEENDYTNSANTNSSIAGSASFNTYLYGHNGLIYYGSSSTATGATFTTNDVMGVLVDLESATNTIQFYKGSAAQGSAFSLTGTGINYTAMSDRGSGSGNGFIYNFGQDSTFAGAETAATNRDSSGRGEFLYDESTGGLAICSANLPTADAVDPAQTDDDYPQKLYNSVLYTGNGASDKAVTGVGFQPDWLWGKVRSAVNDSWIYDSTRGDFRLVTDSTAAQVDYSAEFAQFDSDGWTYGTNANSQNADEATFIGRSLRANGGTTSSNGNGDLTSTVQVDPSGSFSIVSYTGTLSGAGVQTVGHGLSSAPSYIITKVKASGNWWVLSDGQASWNYAMNLNGSGASVDKSGNGSMSAPTPTVFSTNNTEGLNDSGGNIAYCFANCEGHIKSGSYEGNGNANGSFVYCGFRPALIMTKSIDSTSDWQMFDDTRVGYNVDNNELKANSTAAETTTDMIDILSNGFKMRIATDPNVAETYVYLAIAHNPFQYATAR